MLLPDSKTELVRRGNKVVYDLGDKIVKVFNETKPVSRRVQRGFESCPHQ